MRLIAAPLIALVAAGILLWAAAALGWRRWLDLDSAPPQREAPALVLAGPFAFTRHPQTLALLLLLAAAGLRWPRPAMWILALLAAGIVVALAAADDSRLARRFGEAYARYRRGVPFLLPRLW